MYNNLDNDYKNILAEILKCKAENLASIVGPQEFKSTLERLNNDDYSTGDIFADNFDDRFKNVLDGRFKASLHNHTNYSDGALSVEEFLDQATKYADKVAEIRNNTDITTDLPCFITAITDHDVIGGAEKAVRIIAETPDKYKNLKVVLGIEQSVVLEDYNFLKEPLHFDAMCYCLNPFDKNIKQLLHELRSDRQKIAKELIKKFNALNPDFDFDLKKLRDDKNAPRLVKTERGTGFLHSLRNYLNKTTGRKYSSQIYNRIFVDKIINKAPSVEEFINIIRESNFGVLGVAHPGRIDLYNKLDIKKVKAGKYRTEVEQGMFMLLKKLKELGVESAEGYYQYTVKYFEPDRMNSEKWLDNINKCCDDLGLLKAGSQDSHKNIFTHHNVEYGSRKSPDFTNEELSSLLGDFEVE